MASQVDISKALSLGGWMTPRELTWLAITASKSNKVVEFGAHHGRSTRAIADNINKNGVIYAVDPWGGEYTDEEGKTLDVNTYVLPYFKSNLSDHIESKRVIPCRMYSNQFNLISDADFVFIDGDHKYSQVKKDIEKAMEITALKAIIAGHDYEHPMWPGVKRAVQEFFGSSIQTEEQIWWIQKY